MAQMNITTPGTYQNTSDWTRPVEGMPVTVVDGVLKASHFSGQGWVQLWSEKSPFCDHVVDAKLNVLSGNYWNKDKRERIVVLPISSAPTIPDSSKVGGLGIWPPPAFQLKGLTSGVYNLHAFGHWPSEVVNITDCKDIEVNIWLDGTAAYFWQMKGGVTFERSPNVRLNVYSGEFYSTTIARGIGSPNPTVVVHSGCKSRGRNWDSGNVYLIARHKGLDGKEKYSEAGGVVRCYSTFTPYDAVTEQMADLGLQNPHCQVMLDDWYRRCEVYTDGEAYVCGPENHITAFATRADLREGSGWDTKRGLCPWNTNLKGTYISGATKL